MAALQLLLDKLNSGNIPINQTTMEKLQTGGAAGQHTDTTTTNVGVGKLSAGGKQVILTKHFPQFDFLFL